MPLDPELPALVVDDEELTAELVGAFLARLGFTQVDRATDGLDAWTMMRQRPYGLVVSDYRMKPMNGLMFLEAVRQDEEISSVPFLLITAYADPGIARRAAALGTDAFLMKPFTAAGLQRAIGGIATESPALA